MAAEGFVLLLTVWLMRGPSDWASSATSLVALSAGLLLYFALSWVRKHRLQFGAGAWMSVTACIIFFGFSTPIVGGSTIIGASSALGRDSTLTGRTEIWAGIVPDFFNHPILGHGFSGFWTPARTSANQVGQAHNGYLEVSLELGLAGLLLNGILLLSWTRKARRTLGRDFQWGSLCSCFLFMLLIVNIAESSINSLTTPTMAVVLLLSLSVSPGKRRRLPRESHGAREKHQVPDDRKGNMLSSPAPVPAPTGHIDNLCLGVLSCLDYVGRRVQPHVAGCA